MGPEEICRRVQRPGGDVEIAGAVGQYVLMGRRRRPPKRRHGSTIWPISPRMEPRVLAEMEPRSISFRAA
jgi:hypothetical protein